VVKSRKADLKKMHPDCLVGTEYRDTRPESKGHSVTGDIETFLKRVKRTGRRSGPTLDSKAGLPIGVLGNVVLLKAKEFRYGHTLL